MEKCPTCQQNIKYKTKTVDAWYKYVERGFVVNVEPKDICPAHWSCYNSRRSFDEKCKHLVSIVDEKNL